MGQEKVVIQSSIWTQQEKESEREGNAVACRSEDSHPEGASVSVLLSTQRVPTFRFRVRDEEFPAKDPIDQKKLIHMVCQ